MDAGELVSGQRARPRGAVRGPAAAASPAPTPPGTRGRGARRPLPPPPRLHPPSAPLTPLSIPSPPPLHPLSFSTSSSSSSPSHLLLLLLFFILSPSSLRLLLLLFIPSPPPHPPSPPRGRPGPRRLRAPAEPPRQGESGRGPARQSRVSWGSAVEAPPGFSLAMGKIKNNSKIKIRNSSG